MADHSSPDSNQDNSDPSDSGECDEDCECNSNPLEAPINLEFFGGPYDGAKEDVHPVDGNFELGTNYWYEWEDGERYNYILTDVEGFAAMAFVCKVE